MHLLPLVVVASILFVLALWSQHRPHASDHPTRCPDCGTSHPSFARFCRRCGRRLD